MHCFTLRFVLFSSLRVYGRRSCHMYASDHPPYLVCRLARPSKVTHMYIPELRASRVVLKCCAGHVSFLNSEAAFPSFYFATKEAEQRAKSRLKGSQNTASGEYKQVHWSQRNPVERHPNTPLFEKLQIVGGKKVQVTFLFNCDVY